MSDVDLLDLALELRRYGIDVAAIRTGRRPPRVDSFRWNLWLYRHW